MCACDRMPLLKRAGSCGIIVQDLLRMMEVDLVVTLWTCLCISGEVLDFLCHFYVHDKLTPASLQNTCHVICTYTKNISDKFHHGVFLYLVMLLKINTKNNIPCFSVLEICLWEPFPQISDKQSTAQSPPFWSICCKMLLSFFTKTTLVPYLSYQWNGCHIFQHGLFLHMLASVFCFLTCFELRAIVSKIQANGENDRLRIVFFHICNCPQKVI